MPKGQDPTTQAENACHHQTNASDSQQRKSVLYWICTWWGVITAQMHCAMWMTSHMQSPKWNPAILDLLRRINHRGWNPTEKNSHYCATQLTSRDDPASTHWTPWIRKMPQQSQTVNVLAWTVQKIKRTGNKLSHMLEVQLKKSICLANRQHAGHEIPIHPRSKLALNIFHFEDDSYLLFIDYTSRFVIIRKLSSMTGKAIAHHMQVIFAEYR